MGARTHRIIFDPRSVHNREHYYRVLNSLDFLDIFFCSLTISWIYIYTYDNYIYT